MTSKWPRRWADSATIAILQHLAALEAQTINEQLTHALNSRVIIEQAKGMVAERGGLNMEQAFARLRSYARSHNLRLADVANDVILGGLVVRLRRGMTSEEPAGARRSSMVDSGLLT